MLHNYGVIKQIYAPVIFKNDLFFTAVNIVFTFVNIVLQLLLATLYIV